MGATVDEAQIIADQIGTNYDGALDRSLWQFISAS